MSNIGFRIYTKINKPALEIVNKFRGLPVANIADNMNRFGCMDWQIKPITRLEEPFLLGTAVTVKSRICDNLLTHQAIDIAREGNVIVIDAQGNTNAAVLGEIMCRYASTKGINGFVVDGLIRDTVPISKMKNFLVYARGASPRGPFKDGPGEINVPISCGGIMVNPGDIIVGDADGIVAINPEEAAELADKAKAKYEKEDNVFRQIENGSYDHSWAEETLRKRGCEFI